MVFDKYEQLSEDAQRLLCFYVDMGYGSNKRMDEHIYLLGRYCFTAFDGKAALEELTQKGILQLEGKDWYANAPRYGVNADDFVPALWYLYEFRKDLLRAFQKLQQLSSQTYMFVRYAIKQLVESEYQLCSSANVIGKDQVQLFYSVATEPRFQPLFSGLQAESFLYFYENLSDYLIGHDLVVDTTLALTVIEHYNAITEASRCRLLAEMELYEYIATGKTPSGGIYSNIAAGYIMGALRNLCANKPIEAAQWFDMALKTQLKEGGVRGYFKNGLMTFYLVLAYMVVADKGQGAKSEGQEPSNEGHERMAAACRTRLRELVANMEVRTNNEMLPAKLLAEDFCNISISLHKEQVQKLYDEGANGTLPPIYRSLAFLLANYLGYSTNGNRSVIGLVTTPLW